MRNKWSVLYFYPVFEGKKVSYTTSKRYKFKTWLAAKLVSIWFKLVSKVLGRFRWSYMSYISKYSVDTDTGINYADNGAWRSYQLTASGDTLEELIQDASIAEIDQDGGDLDYYPLKDASNEVEQVVLEILKSKVG